jgi:hypothetical protein
LPPSASHDNTGTKSPTPRGCLQCSQMLLPFTQSIFFRIRQVIAPTNDPQAAPIMNKNIIKANVI